MTYARRAARMTQLGGIGIIGMGAAEAVFGGTMTGGGGAGPGLATMAMGGQVHERARRS